MAPLIMNASSLLALFTAPFLLLNCSSSTLPADPEQRRYYQAAHAQLESAAKTAVSVELYADPMIMSSDAYRSSARSKRKGELAEQAAAHWRRVPLSPEQATTLLRAAKDMQLHYCGTPNMRSQPAYALTLVYRDAQGKLLMQIDPFVILPEAPEHHDFYHFYQLDKPRVEQLRCIIYTALDASSLFRKKLTPSLHPCPDCGKVHQVI